MLLSATLRYLPAQVGTPGIQICLFLLWTFYLGNVELGAINLIVASQELFTAVFLTWWQHYMLRFLQSLQRDAEYSSYLSSEIAVVTMLIAAHSVLMAGFVVFTWGLDATSPLLWAAVMLAALQPLAGYLAERSRAAQEIFPYSLLQLAGPTAGLAVSLVAYHSGDRSAALPLFGICAGHAVAILIYLASSRVRLQWPLRIRREILRQALAFGGPLILANGFLWAVYNVCRYVIGAIMGTGAVGEFAVGYGLGMRAISIVVMLVVVAGYPLAIRRLVEAGPSKAIEQLRMNSLLLLAILVPATLGLFVVSPKIVSLFVGPDYQEAAQAILPLAALAGALRGIQNHIYEQGLLLFRRTAVTAYVAVAMAVATTLLSVVFVQEYGIVGAIYALLIVQSVGILVLAVICRRLLDFAVPLVPSAMIGLASAAMLAAVLGIDCSGGVICLVMKVGAGAITYTTAGAVLLLLSPGLRKRAIGL